MNKRTSGIIGPNSLLAIVLNELFNVFGNLNKHQSKILYEFSICSYRMHHQRKHSWVR